jgi:phospholipid transport system substrate-binding protein
MQVVLSAMLLALASAISSAAEHPAQSLVEDSIKEMLDIFKEDGDRLKSEPDFLKAKIDEIIVPNLDFDTMTKLAVGKFWRKADSNQKTELVTEFKRLLLNTYTGALTEYSGEKISFEPFRPESREDRAVVRSSFSQTAGTDVPVIYKLRDKSGWSIYDIEVNNISLVTSYRSAFSNEIEKGGIEGLIDAIKERNSTL